LRTKKSYRKSGGTRPHSKSLLFLGLLRFVRLFHDERFHALEFLLEAIGKIVRSILEKHNEAEREKKEQNEPEEAAQKCHGWMLTWWCYWVNAAYRAPTSR
jgi:hypothetical protein